MQIEKSEDAIQKQPAAARSTGCGRSSRRGVLASAAALLLSLAEPALGFFAVPGYPKLHDLAGKTSSGPVFSGAFVWNPTNTQGSALLWNTDPRVSLILTSLTGTGPALVGSRAIYGMVIQGWGSSLMPDGPDLTVSSSASMATNQSTVPFADLATALFKETYGALSVRSVGVSASGRPPGNGGTVNVNVQGGTLSVGVPDGGTSLIPQRYLGGGVYYDGNIETRFWYPWASAIYASSNGGAAKRPSWSDCEHNQNPSDDGCRFNADQLYDGGRAGSVTVNVGSATSLVLDTSGPEPGYATVKVTPDGGTADVRTPVHLVGVTALSEGGLNGFRGITAGINKWAYSNSGFGNNVAVDFAGSIKATGPGTGVAMSLGIVAASVGGALTCPDRNCNEGQAGADNYNSSYASQIPGGGAAVNVTLRNTGAINLNAGNAVGIMAVSAAGGVEVEADYVWVSGGPDHISTKTSVNDSARSGGAVTVTTEAGSQINVGNAQARFATGVLAVSTGNANMIRPFVPIYMQYDSNFGNPPRFFTYVGSAAGGNVTVSHAGDITTQGSLSVGIAALSVGGSALVGKGDIGAGGNVVSQGTVTVTNTGTITTLGDHSAGIVAYSGAAGGLMETDAGNANGTYNEGQYVGGSNAGGKPGGAVQVTHKGVIQTGQAGGSGKYAIGIVAQSIGGGGGFFAGSAAFVGGQGVNGGNGGKSAVSLQGGVVGTQGLGAIGVLAQSVGGGGGAGGNAAGLFFGLGGRGGTGGDGGEVDVHLNSMNPGVSGAYNRASSIETHGLFSQGVVVQSVGGGGGTGGHATAIGAFYSQGVGGNGGSGGSGGSVTFASDGSSHITTTGEAAHGLVLQSIGGGGGVGGGSVSVSSGAFFSASTAVGGSGGSGGKGGNVTASLKGGGTIQTQGSEAPAVIAQSVGGGGGIGGSATSASFALTIPEYPALSVAVAVGGSGGNGNTAGSVVVLRGVQGQPSGTITTYGEKSEGILVQSIGGGGGTGGDSKAISGSLPSGAGILTVTPAIGIGGSGGTGGLGGNIIVNNYGSSKSVVGIATLGDHASGILAQSVGGGGGNGGIGAATGWNLSGAEVNIQVDVGIGGKGGSGNHGGGVSVTSADTGIQTLGAESYGIHAQSIGGGGGTGGGGGAYGYGNTLSVNVSVGGRGGAGGNAGSVTVNHSGAISTGSQNQVADSTGRLWDITTGGGASGIFAQSIGGGGGQGGSADSSSAYGWLGVASNSKEVASKILERIEKGEGFPAPTFNANVSVGGKGGAAGNGSAVTVQNTGSVITAGEAAFGIHAQSIGGGGGVGGAVEAHSATLANKVGSFTEVAFTGVVSVGGGGGAAGNGGSVDVTQQGSLTTLGHGATGILAQSIGGGGGYGALNTAATEGTFAIGVSKNGNGGLGGSGGKVSITNGSASTLLTLGDDAPGILAQSIGGGGGAGKGGCEHSGEEEASASLSGSKCLGSTKITAGQGETVWTPTSRLALAMGGGTGLSGNGGDVTQQLDGSVETRGNRSIGVVVQSIGGGAAYMTASASTLESTMVSPNAGQNSARGGSISITQGATGRIKTSGAGAWGILAQSIGSGGGLAGDTSLDLVAPPVSNTLANLCCKAPQTMGADGGSITISNAGSITTTGRNAHGIVAQSIGGGGGISGGAEQKADATLKMGNSWQMYSTADRSLLKQSVQASETSDAARNTDVSGEAEAKTSESLTFSAPVQSGQGGAVTIRNAGKVETTGAGSIGILAQSSGNKAFMSQIQVEVQTGGSVKGGSGPHAAAIMVLGGNAANNGHAAGTSGTTNYNLTHNTVKVQSGASVTTVDGVKGMAILARDGLTDVTNYGTITGSIDLGATPGDFKNYGTFNAGAVVVVAKSTLENVGTMVLGGAGTTVISGGLKQDAAGRMQVAVGAGASSPVVSVAGVANIAGTVEALVSGNSLMPGARPLIAATQLSFTGQMASAYLFDWVHSVSGQSLLASPLARFKPEGAALDDSQGSLADYLARAFSGAESSLAPIFMRMYKLSAEPDYKQLLESMAGRALHQHASMALQALPVLMNQSVDCPGFATQGVKLEGGNCLWMKWSPSSGSQGAGENRTPFSSTLVSFGGQQQLASGWWLGGSLGMLSGRAASSRFSSRGETMFGSVALRRTVGEWTFAQSLSLGQGDYDNTRSFALPAAEGSPQNPAVQLDSRSKLTLAALKSRVAFQRPVLASLYVKPTLDLDLVATRHAGFEERASGQALSLKVESGSDTFAALTPTLEAGTLYALGDGGVLHLYGSAGWRWSPNAQRLLRMSIAGTSSASGTFEVTDELPSLTRSLSLGVTMRRAERYDLTLEVSRSQNDRAEATRSTFWFRRYF